MEHPTCNGLDSQQVPEIIKKSSQEVYGGSRSALGPVIPGLEPENTVPPPPLKKSTYAKKFLRNYFRGDCDGFS